MQEFATTGSASSSLAAPVMEHALVRMRRALETADGIVPAGTLGTIVHIYRDGKAVEVEFTGPIECVETVELLDLLLE